MATKCWSTVRGCKMRATLVDECGKPVEGDCSTITNECFVTVAYTAEIEEGDELLLKNACGDVCVVDRGCPEIKYYSVEIEFGQVDPDLFTLLTGQSTVFDYKGDAVGIQVGEKINCRAGFALEVWTIIPSVVCEPGQSSQNYGYFLIPWLTNGILGDFTIENDVMTFSVTAQSKDGHQWNKGPYNVVAQDSAQTAGRLLQALPNDKHLHMQLTSIAPPEHVCGCQSLEYCTEPNALIQLDVDGNQDGAFEENGVAAAPGSTVPVRIRVTNSGPVVAAVGTLTITDENGLSYDLKAGSGTLPAAGACDIPAELAVGQTYECTVNLTNYSPANGVVTTLTAAVVLQNLTDEFCTDRTADTATITTSAVQPPIDTVNGTVFFASGASVSGSGPGGASPSGAGTIECGAGDTLTGQVTMGFNVNDLEDITINTLTIADSAGNSWNGLTGAAIAGTTNPITGLDCLQNTVHLVNATCNDTFQLPADAVAEGQAALDAGQQYRVGMSIQATSNASGTTQSSGMTLFVDCD